MNSLSKEVLTQVVGMESSTKVWTAIEMIFSPQSRSRITNLRIAFANTKKGSMTPAAYISKMKGIGDELAAAGHPISEEEMVSYILASLNHNYDALVATVGAIQNDVTLSNLFL